MHQPVDEEDLAETKQRIVEALREEEGLFGGLGGYFADSRLGGPGLSRLARPLVRSPRQGFNVTVQATTRSK